MLTGRQLGPYQLGDLLGAGGMGEVYRARDTRLHRDVAIKVLPDAFTHDVDRMSRFEREARLLASLNHPHIAAVYGFEEAGAVRGLVLELVEGETLAERLRRGPLPIVHALTLARQICDALDAAHERGIVHRDLKPANIKLTTGGDAKVLDFGLAKVIAGESSADLTQAPTVTTGGTREGTVLGTVAYMSPEQARGQAVDKRADIWAFGCVLYEMLTAQPAFGAATITDTLVRVIEREPDWTKLPAQTPQAVHRLLRRCLDKDAKRRLRDIGEARIELEAITAGDATPAQSPAPSASRAWRYAPWVVAAIVLVAVIVSVAPRLRQAPTSPSSGVFRSVILLPQGQQLDRSGGTHAMALSPDGKTLVYSAVAGDRQLFVRDLTAFEPKALPGTINATQPFFSPDGKSVAYFASGSLHKISLSGGPPQRICEVPISPRGGSWAANDRIVFAMVQSNLSIVPAGGGKPEPLANTTGGVWPEILPDGRVLFTAGAKMAIAALDSSSRIDIAAESDTLPGIVVGVGGFNSARYLPAGYIVYGQGVSVFAQPFDLRTEKMTAAPALVSNSVFRGSGGGAVYFAISPAGVLAYAPAGLHDLVLVTRDGTATPISGERGALRMPRLSPDGRQVATVIDSETRRPDIWLFDVQRGMKIRLTTEGALMPVWSSDGKRVTFNGLREKRADGSSVSATALAKYNSWYPTAWSRNGRHLLFNNLSAAVAAGNGDIWVLVDGTPQPLLTTTASEYHAQFSPDGRWIAYQANVSGNYEVYAARYPGLEGRVVVSSGGGTHPVWSRDGTEIYYRRGSALMAASFDVTHGALKDQPRQLFEGPFVGAGGEGQFDVTADGRFVMTRGDDAAVGRQINVVVNWVEELKSKTAVK